MNLPNRLIEEVQKSIKEKKNCDFTGVYEILSHDKLKKQCFSNQQERVNKPTIQCKKHLTRLQKIVLKLKHKALKMNHFKELKDEKGPAEVP